MARDAARPGRGGGRGSGRAAAVPTAATAAAVLSVALAAAALLSAAPLAVQWADADKPGKPTDLTADDVAPTKVALAWTAPDDDGGEEITGYKIERKEAGGGEFEAVEPDTGDADTTYEDGGLKTGTRYVYRVAAINEDGTSGWSNEAAAEPTSSSSPPEQKEPEKPRSLRADDVSDDEVRLEWKAPRDNNSPPVTGYRIEYKEAGDSEFKDAEDDTESRKMSYTVDGLDEGTEYVFRVSAINSVGTGGASDEARATPSDDSAPGTGQAKPSAPSGVKAESASDTKIYVEWKEPRDGGGTAISGYVIQYQQKSGDYKFAAEVGAEATAFIHEVPNPKTSYKYRVAARNDAGTGPYSGDSGLAKPAHTTKATHVTITELSATSVRLDWLPPSQTYGQAIRGYEILPIFSNGVEGEPIGEAGGRDTSHTIRDLETDKKYRFVVNARVGTAEYRSEEVSVTLTSESGKEGSGERQVVVAQSPPGSPANVKATPRSSGQIELAWDRPAPQGSPAVTGYRVEFREGDGGEFRTAAADTGTAAATYSHTGLNPETEYTYRVSAISGTVVGPPSGEASAATMAAGQGAGPAQGAGRQDSGGGTAPQSASPSAPRNLEAAQGADDRIDLTWSEPDSRDGITSYRIEYSKDGGEFVPLAESGASSTSYSHKKITVGASYSYRVYAMGSDGKIAESNTATITAEAAAAGGGDAEAEEAAAAAGGGGGGGDVEAEEAAAAGGVSDAAASSLGATQGDDPLARVPGFPDPAVGADAYVYLYENDEEFRSFFDEVFPEYGITDIVGEPTGAPVGAPPDDPLTRVPGFPDPGVSAREYVERYESDLAFREWFDGTFPEYGITDVVGDPGPAPPPKAPPAPDEPDRLPYYKDRYDGEAAYRAWFDSYFHGRSLAEVFEADAGRQYGECGAGTVLRDGICQVALAAGK